MRLWSLLAGGAALQWPTEGNKRKNVILVDQYSLGKVREQKMVKGLFEELLRQCYINVVTKNNLPPVNQTLSESQF